MSRVDQVTPAGQPYALIMPPSFAIDILRLLQARTLDILGMVKELTRLVNRQATGVERGDGSSENSSDSEDN
jgi:hypothetical protein